MQPALGLLAHQLDHLDHVGHEAVGVGLGAGGARVHEGLELGLATGYLIRDGESEVPFDLSAWNLSEEYLPKEDIGRPGPDECIEYYTTYTSRVPEGDIGARTPVLAPLAPDLDGGEAGWV